MACVNVAHCSRIHRRRRIQSYCGICDGIAWFAGGLHGVCLANQIEAIIAGWSNKERVAKVRAVGAKRHRAWYSWYGQRVVVG